MSSVRGKTIVLTGTFKGLRRADAENALRRLGATVSPSVTKRTELLIAGNDAGSKLAKARELGVAVEDEAYLHRILVEAVHSAADEATAAASSSKPDVTWAGRFDGMVAELESHPRVQLLRAHRGDGISPSLARDLFARHALIPDADTLAFYAEMNGVSLAWVASDDERLDPVRHVRRTGPLESMVEMESLFQPASGQSHQVDVALIYMPPLETVLGTVPYVDYGTLNDQPMQRIGFDFPGTYYTPAFAMHRGALRVQMAGRHGLFGDDDPFVTFADYLEGVFGTRGSIDWRAKLFGRRPIAEEATTNPRAYLAAHPVTIDSLLPKTAASLSAEPRLARLLEELRTAVSHAFETQPDGRTLVRLVLPDGAKRMTFLTGDELAKIELALQ